MLVYASIANVSVGRMFLGGFGPGLVAAALLMVMTSVMARRRGLPAGQQASLGEVLRAARRASLVLLAPFIVIAGIVGGLFTATESAGIACVYALVLGLGIYRTLTVKDLPPIFIRTIVTTGQVMFVLATASVFSWILARGNVPAQFAQLPFFSDTSPPWLVLAALNVSAPDPRLPHGLAGRAPHHHADDPTHRDRGQGSIQCTSAWSWRSTSPSG